MKAYPHSPAPHQLERSHKQAGSSLVEFCLIALPIILLSLSTLEIIHWNLVRHHTDLALYQALRSGITHNANPNEIQKSFNLSLSVLTNKTPTSNKTRAWLIRVSPQHQDFIRYHVPALQTILNTPYRVMDNDYVEEQAQLSDQGRLRANILHVELWYAHQPLTPGLTQLLRYLARFSHFNSPLSQHILSQGLLVIKHSHALPMQSHAIEWPNYEKHGIYIGEPNIIPAITTPTDLGCSNWWCQSATTGTPNNSSPPSTPSQPLRPHTPSSEPQDKSNDKSKKPPDESGGSSDNTLESDADKHQNTNNNSPECGVSMCCFN